MRVAIIGAGYVGLTTGACLAYIGHEVACIDTDESKIELLRAGRVPIYEPYLEDLLADAGTRIKFTTSYAEAVPRADVIFIAVGTPAMPNGCPDLRFLRSAAQAIGEHLDHAFTVVVNKSTVPIGSGNWVAAIIREAYESAHGKKSNGCFSVASNPEFLREGSGLQDTLYADRVVIGSDERKSLDTLSALYRPILDQSFNPPTYLPRPEDMGAVPLIATDLPSAELIKYAANAFLALKISYINEISQLTEKVGADITQVARGIGLDGRIGTRFLHAGIGWGGSCFGKDTAALASTAAEYGLDMPIVNAARAVNQHQRDAVVEKLLASLWILKGRTVGLLGLAFKPNTDDLRDAPAIDIARQLVDRGCKVKVHDPVAMNQFRRQYADLDVVVCDTPTEVATDADAVVLVTEWPEYRDLDWGGIAKVMATPIVLDGRNVLDPTEIRRSGFRYIGVGIPELRGYAASAI